MTDEYLEAEIRNVTIAKTMLKCVACFMENLENDASNAGQELTAKTLGSAVYAISKVARVCGEIITKNQAAMSDR